MRWRKCTWVSCRKASRTQQRFNERGMRTKQALVVILGVALVALLRLSPKAVDMGNPVILVQPPPEDTNCYPASSNVLCDPEPGPVFLSTGATNQCNPDAMIVAWAAYTNLPGTVTTTITYSNPACPALVTTNEVSSVSLTNWWEATGGAVPSSGPGLGASFALINCGGGTVYFHITYSNAPPCSNAMTISTSVDYAIDAACGHHESGEDISLGRGMSCGSTNWPWGPTNSLCGDSFSLACTDRILHAYVNGVECGYCPYDPSLWTAVYTFCQCKARLKETQFSVVDTGPANPTFGQGQYWRRTCTNGCTHLCYVVTSWGTNSDRSIYPIGITNAPCGN